MTKQEFYQKHREFSEDINTHDVLTRIAGAISNLHMEKTFFSPQEMDERLNEIKEYIFDYQDLLKTQ
mgnify:FL=1|tara:strand:- start:628 stop:828 length:201 start_codon:yes stop_codon:yes gene_type:complete